MSNSIVVGGDATTGATGPNDAALAAKMDAAAAEPAKAGDGKPQRPESIPEKFWDAEKGEVRVEELAKSYAELEKGKSQQKPDGTAAAPADGDGAMPLAQEAKDAMAAAGLDLGAMSEEFGREGKFTDATYEALAKAGYPREMVDTYVAGMQAKGQALMSAAYDGAGGQEQFALVQQWAATNASEADLAAYNRLVGTGDPAQIKAAASMLAQKYAEAEGTPAQRVINGNGNAPAETGLTYGSWEQVSAAVKDPRYKTDPSYRKAHEAKLSRSRL